MGRFGEWTGTYVENCYHVKQKGLSCMDMSTYAIKPTYKKIDNNRYWRCRQGFTFPDGYKMITGSGKTKLIAYERFYKSFQKHANGLHVNNSKITVQQWAEQWLTNYKKVSLSAATMALYKSLFKNHVFPAIGSLSLQRVTRDNCQTVINKMVKNKKSSSTIHHVYNIMEQLFDGSIVEGLRAKSPMVSLSLPRLKEKQKIPFTKEELGKINNVLSDMFVQGKGNLAYCVVTQFLMETGARRGEALGLMWDNVDKVGDAKGIHKVKICSTIVYINGTVVEKETPKTDSSIRITYISKDLFQKMNVLGHDYKYVFHTSTLKPISPNNYLKWFRKLCRVAGVPYRSPHTLRHTFVTNMADMGASRESIKALTGHTTDKMLSHYSHIVPSSVTDTAEKYLGKLQRIKADY